MTVIFWDFDGTLTHAKSLWTKSLCRALAETDADLTYDIEQLRDCLRRGFPWHTPDADLRHLTGEAWWAFMEQHFYESYLLCGIPTQQARQATDKIRGIIKEPQNYHFYEDTIEALEEAHKKKNKNVLLSNNYPDLPEVLQAIGLDRYLDDVIVSGIEGYDKPREELFALAKRRNPADNYYMVGDNAAADILGGRRSGMTTVYVHKGNCDQADHCFDTLMPVIALIKRTGG